MLNLVSILNKSVTFHNMSNNNCDLIILVISSNNLIKMQLLVRWVKRLQNSYWKIPTVILNSILNSGLDWTLNLRMHFPNHFSLHMHTLSFSTSQSSSLDVVIPRMSTIQECSSKILRTRIPFVHIIISSTWSKHSPFTLLTLQTESRIFYASCDAWL